MHTVASYLRDNGMSSYLTSQSTLVTRTRQVNAPGKLSEELLHRTLSPMTMGEGLLVRPTNLFRQPHMPYCHRNSDIDRMKQTQGKNMHSKSNGTTSRQASVET